MIIGILVSASTVSYSEVIKASRDARRKSDLRKLQEALELYRTRYGTYPVTSSNPSDFSSVTASGYYSSETGDVVSNNNGNWIPGAPTLVNSGIIPQLPKDPIGGRTSNTTCLQVNQNWKRAYLYKSDGRDYKIVANCSPENPQTDSNGNWSTSDAFYDPQRINIGWQVSSSSRSLQW